MKNIYVGMSADLIHPGHNNIIQTRMDYLGNFEKGNFCEAEQETRRTY